MVGLAHAKDHLSWRGRLVLDSACNSVPFVETPAALRDENACGACGRISSLVSGVEKVNCPAPALLDQRGDGNADQDSQGLFIPVRTFRCGIHCSRHHFPPQPALGDSGPDPGCPDRFFKTVFVCPLPDGCPRRNTHRNPDRNRCGCTDRSFHYPELFMDTNARPCPVSGA